jgi:hypothetical protein
MLAIKCLAQEQSVPIRRILPQDIARDSIKEFRVGTNVMVRWAYTEDGARKMLAFEREHAGHRVLLRIGTFEHLVVIPPVKVRPPGWTDEGWLQWRTDKFFAVSEEDARKIITGLKGEDSD